MNREAGVTTKSGPHVHELIRSAEKELFELLERRAEIMKRIGTIKQTLAGLAAMFGDSLLSDDLLLMLDRKPSSRQPGFTRACRTVLMESGAPLSTRQICILLKNRFPETLEHHKDPIASVATVLNRLVDYSEARRLNDAKGRRLWQWSAQEGVDPLPGAGANSTANQAFAD